MIHYTCDRCNRVIDPCEDLHYIVKFEVQAVMDSAAMDEPEDDRDHLLEVHEILERAEDDENELVGDEIYHRRRFDLCPDCYRKFNSDPVGSEKVAHLNFSQN